MSWDVHIFAAKTPPAPLGEMPHDFQFADFESCQRVREQISACLPETDWSDPTYGLFNGEGFTCSFNIHDKEPCESIGVRVTGGGDAAGALMKLSQNPGWYLLDVSACEWFHHMEDLRAGWEAFQAYRDRVMGKAQQQEPPGP